jgi:organic hydroperoxide reductase OsmC/OhrA
MNTMTVQLRSIPDTEAAIGWAGAHTVVIDRAEGKAGGRGLGFNGGQLLGLAIGGCFCNDLHYVAHDMGIRLAAIRVDVTMTFEGSPLRVTRVRIAPEVEATTQGADIAALLHRAAEVSTVSNSIRRGVAVELAPRLVTAAV